jgi:hypothetical protein
MVLEVQSAWLPVLLEGKRPRETPLLSQLLSHCSGWRGTVFSGVGKLATTPCIGTVRDGSIPAVPVGSITPGMKEPNDE